MPVEGPLPQTGDQQDTGADADRCFRARTPLDWRLHGLEGTDDYGLDYQVQTTPGQRATDIFRVQLKGTRAPLLSSDGEFISIQLKASTVRFYDRIVEPILLVVCDLSADPDPVDCPLYYAWIRDELRRVGVSTMEPGQKYVTLRVKTSSRLKAATDLSGDIDAQNELARAGHALSQNVERTRPGMLIEERVAVVQGIASSMASRSATFIEALASPAQQHWIEPTPGSLAWHLKAAATLLKTGALDRATIELDTAGAKLADATTLELGEYWFLLGKLHTGEGDDASASASFERAQESHPQGKYVAARVEAQLRLRHAEDGAKAYPDLISLLIGDDAQVMSARSRVLAAEGKSDEAMAVADEISGSERYAARALTNTIFSRPSDVLADCDTGLALADLPDSTRQLLLILRARARFSIAQASAVRPPSAGGMLPPSGLAGLDPVLVRAAWNAIQEAVDLLRDAGWSSNIDHLADIWGATASMMGKQKLILPELSHIARLRPRLSSVQAALESVAAQCGDFRLALEANDRLGSSNTRDLRRTLLLHEAQKHTECFRWFDRHFDKFDRDAPLFGPAATVAALSAHKLSEPSLVQTWSNELESHPHLEEHAAMLHYYLAVELNKIDNKEALEMLTQRYESLGRPFGLAIALLQEFDPTDAQQAVLCVQLGQRIRTEVELSATMAACIGLALVTMKDWDGLLLLCEQLKMRIDAGPRMAAFEALALDQLGRTQKARELLQRMLEGGVLDSLALNTYVAIMVRCGYVAEALDAAEKIMESATSKHQRMECTRLLFNLVHQSDPGSPRLLALAVQMGHLADPTLEVQEGIYLVMFLMATLDERNAPASEELATFRRRSDAFFTIFPDSHIIKQGELRKHASSAELIDDLKALIGFSESREAFQRRTENQIQRGLTAMPFSWRPKLVLASVSDVVHLWEIAKRSSFDDKKYHLVMLTDATWTAPAASALRDRTPLLDLTALLVLFDLELIDETINFFGQVAIAKATLEKLAEFTHPLSGSPFASRCAALQDALKPHLGAIMQPSISAFADADETADQRGDALGQEHKELVGLCQRDDSYHLYSDDLFLRIFVANGTTSAGFCTLDVLAGLEECGGLTRQDVAHKIAMLCSWHVGLVVRFEELAALLPPELASVSSVVQGMETLSRYPDFIAVTDAIWDFRSRFEQTLQHAVAALRRLADETTLPSTGLASLLGLWFVKAGMKDDAPPTALDILTKAIARAALIPNLSNLTAAKLWSVYGDLVEFHHGAHMDERKEREAIRLLGAECAKLRITHAALGSQTHSALRLGLTEGTSKDADFMAGYADTLARLGAQSKRQ